MDYVVGSKMLPDPAELVAAVERLALWARVKLASSETGLAGAHNAFTAYSVLMAFAATGHRPVMDPFCFRDDLDLLERVAVVNDKAVSPVHENRLVWFPTQCAEQFQAYFDHLEGLVERLAETEGGQCVAASIVTLLDKSVPKRRQAESLFFFLSEDLSSTSYVCESSLKRCLSGIWPFELNVARHVLESRMAALGCQMPAIDAQMGHMHGGVHPFSEQMAWSAREAGALIESYVGIILKEQGWNVIPGLKRMGSDLRQPKHGEAVRKFAPELRKEKRERKRQRAVESLRLALSGVITKKADWVLVCTNAELQRDIRAAIDMQCSEAMDIAAYVHRLFSRLVFKKARELKVRVPGWGAIVEGRPGPFGASWLRHYVQGRELRERFARYLNDRPKETETTRIERRWAELVISAAVFGALIRPEYLVALLEQGPTSFQKVRKAVFVDIHLAAGKVQQRSPDARWYPDSISRAMVHGLLAEGQLLDSVTAKAEFQSLCRMLNVPGRSAKSQAHELCKLIRDYWAYHLPTPLASLVKGKASSTVLPTRVLARHITGMRIPAEVGDDVERSGPSVDYHLTLNSTSPSRPASGGKDFKKAMTQAFNAAAKIKGKAKQKKCLKGRVRELFQHENDFPPVAGAIASWVLMMLSEGAVRIPNPKLNTIKRYYDALAAVLIELAGDSDFLDLSDADYEDIYQRACYFKKIKDRKYRAERILFFHSFLERQFGVEPIDASAVLEGVSGDAVRQADAQIITNPEYFNVLKLLENERESKPYQALWTGAMLVLGRRFGLRVGEAIRLCIENVQIYGDDIVIQVHTNRFGDQKSPAAVRQIPAWRNLEQIEWRFIRGMLERANELGDGSPATALFTDEGHKDRLIDRSLVWREIHRVVRQVIGDEHFRFHHLRHTWANELFCLLFDDAIDSKVMPSWSLECVRDSSIYWEGCGKSNVTDPWALFALCDVAGHTDPITTLASYVHFSDAWLAGMVAKQSWPHLTLECAAYLLNQEPGVLKKRARNYSIKKPCGIDVLRTIKWDTHVDDYPVKKARWPAHLKSREDRVSRLSMLEVDRVLAGYAIRGRRFQGLDDLTGVASSDVRRIVQCGMAVEHKAGVEYYALGQSEDDVWLRVAPQLDVRALRAENKAFPKLLKALDDRVLSLGDEGRLAVAASLNSWAEAVFRTPDQEMLLFASKSRVREFLQGLQCLGIQPSVLAGRVGRDLSQVQADGVVEELKSLGLGNVVRGQVPFARSNIDALHKSRVALTLIREGGLQIRYTKSLNRALFVLSTLVEADSLNKSTI